MCASSSRQGKINGSNSEISDTNLNFFYYPVRDWRGRRLKNVWKTTELSFVAVEILMSVIHAVARRLLVNSGAEICMLHRHTYQRLKW